MNPSITRRLEAIEATHNRCRSTPSLPKAERDRLVREALAMPGFVEAQILRIVETPTHAAEGHRAALLAALRADT